MSSISTCHGTEPRQPESESCTLDSIAAMRVQERLGSYRTLDYLNNQECPPSPSALANDESVPLDADCRYKMCIWCYQVCDYVNFKREIVAIAMSYLDRFLVTPRGRLCIGDRILYKLACMTCLYTAVKVHCTEAIDPQVISGLSRGDFEAKQVEHTELVVLESLCWKLNPPTAVSFIYNLVRLIHYSLMSDESKATVVDLAKYQAELAVNDYDFVTIEPSTIALATLANAMDGIGMSIEPHSSILTSLAQAAEVDIETDLFNQVRIRLYEAITSDGTSGCSHLSPQKSEVDELSKTSSSVYFESPRSVTATPLR